jgi:hypothetical protein
MRIGVVGGLERNESDQHRLAKRYGHETIFHPGHLQGRGTRTLQTLIDQSDLVVIVTDVNSHGAVQLTRRLMRAAGREPVLVRRLGLSRLEELLQSLTAQAAPA